jgi:hypothetical protein
MRLVKFIRVEDGKIIELFLRRSRR